MAEIVISSLEPGRHERFELRSGPTARLTSALSEALGTASASKEVDDLLRLVVALRTELDSPSAADQLEALLRDEALAQTYLRRYRGSPSSIDQTRAHERFLGGRPVVRAPTLASPAPGGVRVADFITSSRRDPAEVHRKV